MLSLLTVNGRPITLERVVSYGKYRLKKLVPNLSFLFSIFDYIIPKRNDYWILPVYFIGKGDFSDSNLAIFEIIKNDPKIIKIILTRESKVAIDGINTIVIPMNSLKAVWYLMRSKIIFIQHSIWLDLAKAKFQIYYQGKREIIQLWHGIPIKDISHQNTGIINKRSLKEMSNYHVTCYSETDKKNMQKAFYKVDKDNFWITGAPRNDFLLMKEEKLPDLYQFGLKHLRKLLSGRKLILYAPTYRETTVKGTHYNFSEDELDRIEEFLLQNDCVLGLRYHIYRKPDFYKNFLQRKNIIDLDAEVISDVRLIIRESKIVISDYSSVFVESLYLDKRCISFAYDYKSYFETQRGFFYDFESIFPGDISYNFDELMEAISNANKPYTAKQQDKIKIIKSTLFKYIDDNNSQRVVNKVKELVFE